jgi:hypothetical protein
MTTAIDVLCFCSFINNIMVGKKLSKKKKKKNKDIKFQNAYLLLPVYFFLNYCKLVLFISNLISNVKFITKDYTFP